MVAHLGLITLSASIAAINAITTNSTELIATATSQRYLSTVDPLPTHIVATPVSTGISSKTSVFLSFLIGVGVLGILANGYVMLAFAANRRDRHRRTNLFICNQTALDFFTSIFMVVSVAVMAFGPPLGPPTVGSWLRCLFIDGQVIEGFGVFGSSLCLVLIALERYAKICHTVWHRKYYRHWMTKAGLILPWLNPIVSWLIPNWSTIKLATNVCIPLSTWPNAAMRKAFILYEVGVQFIVPILVFVVCYSKIVGVVRRRTRAVTEGHVIHVTEATSAKNSNRTAQQQLHQAQAAQTEANVIKTMILVCASFSASWLPLQTHLLLMSQNIIGVNVDVQFSLYGLAYVNLVTNPIIYAANYDAVKTWWCGLSRRTNAVAVQAGNPATSSARRGHTLAAETTVTIGTTVTWSSLRRQMKNNDLPCVVSVD